MGCGRCRVPIIRHCHHYKALNIDYFEAAGQWQWMIVTFLFNIFVYLKIMCITCRGIHSCNILVHYDFVL